MESFVKTYREYLKSFTDSHDVLHLEKLLRWETIQWLKDHDYSERAIAQLYGISNTRIGQIKASVQSKVKEGGEKNA